MTSSIQFGNITSNGASNRPLLSPSSYQATERGFTQTLFDNLADICGRLDSWVYEYSIFQAIDSQALEQKKKEQKNLTTLEKIQLGCKAGLMYIPRLVVAVPLASLALSFDKKATIPKLPFFPTVILRPALAVGLMTLSSKILSYNKNKAQPSQPTDTPQKDRSWKWLNKAVVFAVLNAAALSFANYSFMGLGLTIVSIAIDILFPSEAILAETTGSFVAPLASAISSNALGYLHYRLQGF